jgi:hypothetical protein
MSISPAQLAISHMNLFKILSAIFLATQLIACGGGGSAIFGALPEVLNPSTPNNATPPIANAGITQNVSLGVVSGVSSKAVKLNGTGSTIPDSVGLTATWTLTKPIGSAAVLVMSGANDLAPTFTADIAGTYTAKLSLKDSRGLVSLDTPESVVTIVASITNSKPVANAGVDQFVVFGPTSTVTLDGTYSKDDDNNQLTYEWTFLEKPPNSAAVLSPATLTGTSTSARPTFKADVAGKYQVQLTVNDGIEKSAPRAVIVMAGAANVQPTANAGDDKNVSVNSLVTLDGTNSSDTNFDTLTYLWSWMASPSTAPALSSASSPKPTFTPTTAGTYVLSLVVNDGKLPSTPDPITITVSAANSLPVAVAGADQNVVTTSVVTLDGSASTDADKLDVLTYLWSLNRPTGSAAALSSATAAKPTFTADVSGVYVASLIVNDSKASSANQSLTRVTAAVANSAPVSIAGTAQAVTGTGTVTLSGSGTDANGDTITYKWYLTSKPTNSVATLANSTTATPTFTPDIVGIYVATLIVNDGKVDSAPTTVTITRGS